VDFFFCFLEEFFLGWHCEGRSLIVYKGEREDGPNPKYAKSLEK